MRDANHIHFKKTNNNDNICAWNGYCCLHDNRTAEASIGKTFIAAGVNMPNKKILVFDEESFARICHALLQLDGYPAVCLDKMDIDQAGELEDYGLVITSYPYGLCLFPRLKHRQTPVLVLSDCLSRDLLECLKSIRNSLCMVKPIDYEQFRGKIRNVMNSDWEDSDVCEIV